MASCEKEPVGQIDEDECSKTVKMAPTRAGDRREWATDERARPTREHDRLERAVDKRARPTEERDNKRADNKRVNVSSAGSALAP